MNAPQITMIVLIAIGGTITLLGHGSPKGTHNFFSWVFAAAIEIGILYWGGFFN